MEEAQKRARMPKGSAPVLEYRSLERDYSTLLPVLRTGMRVLDIGCGPGSISSGIAERIGPQGRVVGIDSSEHLIARGRQLHQGMANLELQQADLFSYQPEAPFDLVVSARVLQWLKEPKAALRKIMTLLKPGGLVSILDYDHTQLEWHPAPTPSMQRLYQAFLQWRADAGMNNQIAVDLPAYLQEIGYRSIEQIDANEAYQKGAANFLPKIGIWTQVALTRGQQLVKDAYLTEEARLQAIAEYEAWIASDAERMIMKLKEVRGRVPA